MTGALPRDWREGRRLRAWELAQAGWPQRSIAAALGVTEGAVSQWVSRARAGGVEALRHRPAPGAPPKLPRDQLARLPALLDRGPPAFGFRGNVWTCPRVAAVIARQFGVRYTAAHVSRLLRQLRWRPQRPIRRASQRDPQAIAQWYAERWPALKKGGQHPADEALGRSRGGFTTKLHLSCDGRGRPLSLVLTAGQVHDSTQLGPVLDGIAVPRPQGRGRPRKRPDHLLADKGYSSPRCRQLLRRRGIPHTIPERQDQAERRRRRPSLRGRCAVAPVRLVPSRWPSVRAAMA